MLNWVEHEKSSNIVSQYLENWKCLHGRVAGTPNFGSQGLGLNPTGSGIQLITVALFIMSLALFWYDLNNVERDLKHQII